MQQDEADPTYLRKLLFMSKGHSKVYWESGEWKAGVTLLPFYLHLHSHYFANGKNLLTLTS